MEIQEEIIEQRGLIEEGKNRENFLAFWDFCLDFFGRDNCGSLLPQARPGKKAEHE